MNQVQNTTQNADNGLQLSGALTRDSVTAVYRQHKTAIAEGTRLIDLAGVKRVDSAGLALLLEWQSLCKKSGDRLHIRNASKDLMRLAALSNSVRLLGLDDAA